MPKQAAPGSRQSIDDMLMPSSDDEEGGGFTLSTPHMRAIINTAFQEAAGGGSSAPAPPFPQGAQGAQAVVVPSIQDRVAFIVQRRRDALNCYLRTCCMRLSDDIVMGCDEPDEGGI
jgi:hypothetical protein